MYATTLYMCCRIQVKLKPPACGQQNLIMAWVLPGVRRMTDMVMREHTTRMTSRAMAIPFQFLWGGLTPPRSCRQTSVRGKQKHIQVDCVFMMNTRYYWTFSKHCMVITADTKWKNECCSQSSSETVPRVTQKFTYSKDLTDFGQFHSRLPLHATFILPPVS